MPTSTNLNYYPGTSGIWAGPVPWYAAAVIAALAVVLVLIFTRQMGGGFKAFIALVIAVGLFGAAALLRAHPPETWMAPVFAPKTMLATLWENYKQDFIDLSGRTIDDRTTGQTTSEAEGYAMLRAVWMDDKPAFDASWKWTQANLQRNDHLFSWLYGTRSDGTLGILTAQNGENSASDADTDIALALVFAYSRWQDPAYLNAALPVIRSIWNKEVFYAKGEPYLGVGNFASASSTQEELIDPSYLSPYAYRIFSFVDPHDDWQGLTDSSYQVLENSIEAPLDASTSADLPPDWVEIDTATGALSAPPASDAAANVTTDYGYDALRVPWRIGLDWAWYHDPRDQAALGKMAFLESQWRSYGFLNAVYQHGGTPAAYYQTPAMYGGSIGYFLVADPADASAVYDQKLVPLYDPDTETWNLPLDYYDANVAWFGMALYNGALPNLFMLNLPSSSTPSMNP